MLQFLSLMFAIQSYINSSFILQASSKQQVVEICENAFKHREKEIPPNHILKPVAESFNTDFTETSKVSKVPSRFIY